jgi:hypothetical protein
MEKSLGWCLETLETEPGHIHDCEGLSGHEGEHHCFCGFKWPKTGPPAHGNLNWLRDEEL